MNESKDTQIYVFQRRGFSFRGVEKDGSERSDDPSFSGANVIHFLYKVSGKRSVELELLFLNPILNEPPWKIPSDAPTLP